MDAPQGDASARPFVTTERVRLAEAIRHLIDAALTAEDSSEEALAAAADETERLATDLHGRHELGDRPSGVRQREESSHDDYLPRSPLVGDVTGNGEGPNLPRRGNERRRGPREHRDAQSRPFLGRGRKPFLNRLAKIFQGLAVQKVNLACRTQGKYKPRNGVDD